MNAKGVPAIIQAELMVASKIRFIFARKEAIEKVLRNARQHYPECFVGTQNNPAMVRTKTNFEKYIDYLKMSNLENFNHENYVTKCSTLFPSSISQR